MTLSHPNTLLHLRVGLSIAHVEVPRFGVMGHDRARALLGLELILFAQRDADALGSSSGQSFS